MPEDRLPSVLPFGAAGVAQDGDSAWSGEYLFGVKVVARVVSAIEDNER